MFKSTHGRVSKNSRDGRGVGRAQEQDEEVQETISRSDGARVVRALILQTYCESSSWDELKSRTGLVFTHGYIALQE